MGVNLGLDIGAISLKLAALGNPGDRGLMEAVRAAHPDFRLREVGGRPLLLSDYRRIAGSPIQSTYDLLHEFYAVVPEDRVEGIRVTGSGSRTIAKLLGLFFENEFKAIARTMGAMYPQVRTIFELGGGSAKYIRISNGGITDYDRSGERAAGTGSFLDQQALRMQYSVEEVGQVVCTANCAARIAGRCSVFAKSDMIHAQQKGYSPAEILRGLCDAVARNFKSAIVKGRPVAAPVALIGAVSQNAGVTNALREAFGPAPEAMFVPEEYAWCGAIGTAMLEAEEPHKRSILEIHRLRQHDGEATEHDTRALSTENVVQLRDRVGTYVAPLSGPIPAYLGLDIGSVSTNVVVIDEFGTVIHDIYLRTAGRPIEAVQQGLSEVAERWRSRLEIRGVGTTGSGRELIAEFVGADAVNDEITAHKTGALHISQTLGGEPVDTIFEIGGGDSKFISIENGVVVDFAMNEACAAGTGSFLEEQAEKLGISIKGEFARLALGASGPTRLGERCTVFMERDVTGWLHKGETVPNLVAGLAYSIALNYLNRVVRGRKVGNVIYFQGGTAYNDAVTAAFASLLGKKITVPPYNGVMGAIGMALIARQWHQATRATTRFRGYDLRKLQLATRDFVCKACSNLCDMKEFTIEGQKSYWGDKCSGKFRKPSTTGRKPVIEDLFAYRERLLDQLPEPRDARFRIGLPRAMSTLDRLPFWKRYFAELGIATVVSPVTDPRICGSGSGTGGRAAMLSGAGRARAREGAGGCGRGLRLAASDGGCGGGGPLVRVALLPVEPNAGVGAEERSRPGTVRGPLSHADATFPARTGADQEGPGGDHAAAGRDTAGERSRGGCGVCGTEVIPGAATRSGARGAGEAGVDRGTGAGAGGASVQHLRPRSELRHSRKLRHRYGANVIPLDFLVTGQQTPEGAYSNMFWISGRKILEAARLAASRPNLHLVCITNFKCGPDSYIKAFAREAAEAPLLVLQFDGHGNDAGYMTRCEAYLDSKGILRCYQSPTQATSAAIQ